MWFTQSACQKLAGQNDVQPSLHVPTVYVDLPPRPLLWEYRMLSVDTREEALPDEVYLNELGSQGWLLVNMLEQRISQTGSRIYYHFVRPKEV